MDELSRLERELDSKSVLQKAIDWYFEPKAIEKWRNGKIYEILGIKKFKKLLTNFGPYKRSIRTESDLDDLDNLLNISELVHSPATVFFGGMTAYSFSHENYVSAAIGGIGFVTNAYCTMLQRYNRTKTHRIRQRMQERQQMLAPK